MIKPRTPFILTFAIIAGLIIDIGDMQFTRLKTDEAGKILCRRIVEQNPGAPPRWGRAADQEPIYENPLHYPGVVYGETTGYEMRRVIGRGVKTIEDGTIHHYPERWYKYRTGRRYPNVTVPKHCAYSIGIRHNKAWLGFWTWGQNELTWHQSTPNTIPTATHGKPFAGVCHFSTTYHWFDKKLEIGIPNQKCGRDHRYLNMYPNHPPQGAPDIVGLRYREHVVR